MFRTFIPLNRSPHNNLNSSIPLPQRRTFETSSKFLAPQGGKGKYTEKQKRQALNIEHLYEDKGVPHEKAAQIAWSTVNKTYGGGLHEGGSGYEHLQEEDPERLEKELAREDQETSDPELAKRLRDEAARGEHAHKGANPHQGTQGGQHSQPGSQQGQHGESHEHLRGFAKMKEEDPERLHEIQSKGGHHSHQGQHSHQGEQRSQAGSQQGQHGESHEHLRGFAKMKEEDPERLHEIQSKGGHHSHQGQHSHPGEQRSQAGSQQGQQGESHEHLRGFAKMKEEDPERLHEIQSKGGHHSHQGKQSNQGDQGQQSHQGGQQRSQHSLSEEDEGSHEHLRGFAKMKEEDPDRFHEISSKGGHHSHRSQ